MIIYNMENLFDNDIDTSTNEVFTQLFKREDLIIEKIVSEGQITPEGEFIEQSLAEWVVLLQGEAKLYMINTDTTVSMNKGDYLYIAPNEKHRILYTSKEPKCIWLAIHFKI